VLHPVAVVYRGKGEFGGFKPPRNPEVLQKLSLIPSSVEYTSVTTKSEYGQGRIYARAQGGKFQGAAY
jgi:hypothetical protein